MKVCLPVKEYRGLDSSVYGHFGSAPSFALVDTDTMAVEQLANRDHDHRHGACSPLKAISGRQIDTVIVGGIGAGAIRELHHAGIKVFQFGGGTVAEAVRLFQTDDLPVLTMENACGGHQHGGPCGHHAL